MNKLSQFILCLSHKRFCSISERNGVITKHLLANSELQSSHSSLTFYDKFQSLTRKYEEEVVKCANVTWIMKDWQKSCFIVGGITE